MSNTYLPSKARYEILDGLRGVAAMIVLLYHHFDLYIMGTPADAYINHGYLAVDFFFILSGYVIGYAYDDRWNRMSLWGFFKRRLTRLHPMIVLATFFGMVFFYYGSGPFFSKVADASPWAVLACAVASVFMFPLVKSLDIRGWSELNPLNGNAWTLYYEYLANILYALFIRKFSKKMLAIFVGCSALLTLSLCLNIDFTGFLAERPAQAYTVIGGWTLDKHGTFIAFVRLLYPFFMGLLLSRIGKTIHVKNGFWVCSVLLIIMLVFPRVGGHEHYLYNGIYEALCILVFFPILVTMGAGSHVTGKSAKICKFLGDISYPLYVLHYGIVYGTLGPWKTAHPEATLGQTILINAGTYLFCVFLAYVSLKGYDEPVREWLKEHWLKKSKKQA